MNGIKYLFDTNALINFLDGLPQLQPFSIKTVCVSVISVIEFLSFASLDEKDRELLFSFIDKIEVVHLNMHDLILLDTIAEVRATFKLKLPDAIIAATALHKNAILVTNDRDFKKITTLQIINY